jgi:hypothetical protein
MLGGDGGREAAGASWFSPSGPWPAAPLPSISFSSLSPHPRTNRKAFAASGGTCGHRSCCGRFPVGRRLAKPVEKRVRAAMAAVGRRRAGGGHRGLLPVRYGPAGRPARATARLAACAAPPLRARSERILRMLRANSYCIIQKCACVSH